MKDPTLSLPFDVTLEFLDTLDLQPLFELLSLDKVPFDDLPCFCLCHPCIDWQKELSQRGEIVQECNRGVIPGIHMDASNVFAQIPTRHQGSLISESLYA